MASRVGKGRSEKRELRRTAAQDADKICTTPARESDLGSKIVKNGRFGALLEVKLRKICATPARESDLEARTVKTPGARGVFGSSKCFSRGRRSDFALCDVDV